MSRRAWLTSLAVVVAAGMTSCVDDSEGPAYVALGDSYTAAPGAGRLDDNDGCFRSTNNYPHLIAEERDLDLTDVSCGSATSQDGANEQRTAHGQVIDPQLDALEESTEVVTVGLGANDFNLIGRLITTCVELARSAPTGSPCEDADAAAGESSVAASLQQLPSRLTALLREIQVRAPDADVLAIGYPEIFPAGAGCSELPLAAGDLDFARRVIDGINTAVEAAAREARATYIDVFKATEGHSICSEDPWIAGATADPRRAWPYHPYAEEQQAVADLVLEAID